jgi:UDP-N-acetylglucosamine--N-acetylmuramyl-(pentapeptide) pyrophosphoryl-undecaprenol N-acetylglucosamine transferase
MFGRQAKGFLTTFFATERHYKDRPVIRTGQPIRRQLREAALRRGTEHLTDVVLANALLEGDTGHGLEGLGTSGQDGRLQERATILVLGGSQGSAYLNQAVPNAVAKLEREVEVIHASGPTNFAETSARVKGLNLESYRVEPYLQADAIADAYCQADLLVCRSGSGLAEVAMFGLPSVLVPLPTSADNHQQYNAVEFEEMRAGSIAGQEQAPFARTVEMMRHWIDDSTACAEASRKLKEWDVPDATARIVANIEAAL